MAVSSVDVRTTAGSTHRTDGKWVSAKINSRSWRRAVAASRALGRRPPKRRKALEASSSCGYVLDVATPDGDLSLGPLLSTGSAPAVALRMYTARAVRRRRPVWVKRTGLQRVVHFIWSRHRFRRSAG